MSDTAKFPLAPDKYIALIVKLRTDPDVSELSTPIATTGSCVYQKITFAWVYDGIGELTVAIKEDHNWKAKLAGNEAVFQRLHDNLISQV